ncbi:response regulator [Devosia sp. MC1541]|uniref:response regulator n=1 Tax=Devosia sp. MC1541 TaxID=2725264 RepID=UPI00145C6CD0|nr:response regulator [Devosia sp. MC1541]
MTTTVGQATILVADDDALITMNTVDLLAELGHIAIEAYSGAEALKLLEERADITVLMTDYSMPGITGIELAEAAQKLRPGLKVLLVTGYAELPHNQSSDLPRLEKPYQLDELDSILNKLLGREA